MSITINISTTYEHYKYPTAQSGILVEEPDEPRMFTVRGGVIGAIVGDCQHCAAARELRDEPDVVWAWVKRTRTTLHLTDGRYVRYANSQRLEDAVDGFDNSNGGFPPGTYMLIPVAQQQRTAARRKRGGYAGGHGTRNIVPNPRRRPDHALR